MSVLTKVRQEGLEPSRRKALDPKSSVSANSTTQASVTPKSYEKSKLSINS